MVLIPGGMVQKTVSRDLPDARLIWRRYTEHHVFRCDRCEKDLKSRIVVERRPIRSMVVESICNGCCGELVAAVQPKR